MDVAHTLIDIAACEQLKEDPCSATAGRVKSGCPYPTDGKGQTAHVGVL